MYNQKCVARQSSLKGNKAGQYEAILFPSPEAVGKAVDSGEVYNAHMLPLPLPQLVMVIPNWPLLQLLSSLQIDATIVVNSHMEKQGYKHLAVAAEPSFTCSLRGISLVPFAPSYPPFIFSYLALPLASQRLQQLVTTSP